MNPLQKKEYDILVEFDKVCKENNLQYFISAGTALGAVRHKGFIPWDDDIDVEMKRDDYEKLCRLPSNAFPDNLKLRTVYTEVQHPYMFAKLCDLNTTFVEKGTENLDISHGVFIDIFPMDYVPRDMLKKFLQRVYAEYIWILTAKYREASKPCKLLSRILNIGYTDKRYKARIRWAEKRMMGRKRTDMLTMLTYGGHSIYSRMCFLNKWYKPVDIQFEDRKFPIMKGYDSYLKVNYGDYMKLPPKEERMGGHGALRVDLEKPYYKKIIK